MCIDCYRQVKKDNCFLVERQKHLESVQKQGEKISVLDKEIYTVDKKISALDEKIKRLMDKQTSAGNAKTSFDDIKQKEHKMARLKQRRSFKEHRKQILQKATK